MGAMIRLCLVLAGALMLALPAAAQEPIPSAVVQDAFARLSQMDSYSANVQTDIHQNLHVRQGDQTLTIANALNQQGSIHVQNMNGVQEGYATLVHSFDAQAGGSATALDLTMQMIFLGEDTYVKFSDLSPEMSRSFPMDWVDWQSATSYFPGANLIDTTNTRDLLIHPMIYPVRNDTILWVESRGAQLLEGEPTEHYFVRLDPVAVFDSVGTDALTRLLRDQGVGADREAVRDLLAESMQIDLEVWVSPVDGMLRRVVDTTHINADISGVAGVPLVLDQTTITACQLSGFNERVLVSVPQLTTPDVMIVAAGG